MRLLTVLLLAAAVPMGVPPSLAAQAWDTPAATALVARATTRRTLAEAPDGLQRWEATARGMVLFLSQFGDGNGAPRLIKADDLAVEVYWEAPGRSKQTIVGWRDRAWLPTDIRYHRDHLGIVANDFGPLIRIGDGDEVRDVPHPLSAAGAPLYHFALVDSVTVSSGGREWQVFAVRVRPRDVTRPAVIGTLYLDRESAALVRFQFSFTPAAYREAALEDITVVLENALQSGGYWLPWRQEIEIRRGSSVVDLPIRGIIRGRWELTDHRVGDEVSPGPVTFAGLGGLTAPGGSPDQWEERLEDRLGEVIRPVDRHDFDLLRDDIWRGMADQVRRVGPPLRPAFGALSDLGRFNRVEGLRIGVGASIRLPVDGVTAAPWVGVALATGRVSGRLDLGMGSAARGRIGLRLERVATDLGQAPVISPILNSLMAQEFGIDHGDWAERSRVFLSLVGRSEGGIETEFGAGVESWRPLAVVARSAAGSFRPNPSIEEGARWVAHASIGRPPDPHSPSGFGWSTAVEYGTGAPGYVRLTESAETRLVAGSGVLRLAMSGGWGSGALPTTRGFVLGGRGTLPGTSFRAFGGRRHGLARVEWLATGILPGVSVGNFPPIRPEVRIGPFVALGAAGGQLEGVTWQPSRGIRSVAGIAMEGLLGLVRLELGYDPRTSRFAVQGDLSTGWWKVL